MAPVVAAIVETKIFISSINSTQASVPIREQDYDSTTSTKSLSYYSTNSTAPVSNSNNLRTIYISRTATIILTTIELITGGSTVATLAPTETPFLLPASTNIHLSPGQIAGIVLGTIIFLLITILIVYLLLTRAKWMGKLKNWRPKQREEKNRRKTRPPLNKATNPTEKHVENPARTKRLNDRRQMGAKWMTETTPPLERGQEPNERPKEHRN
ncbi:hypothetical protein GGR51DRAFT_573809 [Nemania sp. FL0031]|nr:hypothetical protein GGR51DRAFT_573809 [Nemania sp. FL0031]